MAPLLPAAAEPIPVIDVHMHAPLPGDYPGWAAAMDELHETNAILIGVPGQLASAPDPKNRFFKTLMFPCENGKAPNVGFKCFADGSEFPDIAMVRKLVEAGQIRGLGEIVAQYAGIAPDDPRLEPYYALAEERDLPVGIHMGIGPPGAAYPGKGFPPNKSPNYRGEAGDPLKLENVLVRHPNLRLYVMHAAYPFRDRMIYMLYMHPKLYVDVSVLQWAIPRAAYYDYLRELVDAGFGKRIMFGSDGGVKHLREGVQAILQADFLSDEQKRDILHDNAMRFFRFDTTAKAN
jgi:hypothetical protein